MAQTGYIFDLTDLTRNVNKDRRIVWQGFDVKRRHGLIGLGSALFNGMLAVIMYPVMGQYALIMFFVLFGLPFLLIEGRSNADLRLRHYEKMWDKKNAHTGQFILCNRVVYPGELRTGVIKAASLPVKPDLKQHDVDVKSVETLFV